MSKGGFPDFFKNRNNIRLIKDVILHWRSAVENVFTYYPNSILCNVDFNLLSYDDYYT